MTISSTTRKTGIFVGNDSSTVFPFTFKVFQASEVYVVRLDTETNVETELTLTTDYTVSLNADQNANPGGTVTLVAGALATGFNLVITSDITPLQATDLTNQGGFYPSVITNALDKLTIIAQQILERLSRSLTLPLSVPSGVSTELPSPERNALIAWNQGANGLQNLDPTGLATVVAFGTANADLFDGDDTTTQFNLSANPGALYNLDVSIDGVTQTPGVDYTWTSGTVITFTSAPPAGTDNVLVRYMQALPQGVTDASLVNADDGSSGSLFTTVAGFISSVLSSAGSAIVGFIQGGTGATSRSAQSKMRDFVHIKDFGAVCNGVADDSAAVRRALDTGRDVFMGDASDTVYLASTVYLPKGTKPRRIFGSAVIVGQGAGVGTIFETGDNTVSTGAGANWNQPEVHLHYNTVIEGLKFQDCEFALKLYNFLQGCIVRDCSFQNCRTNVYAKRSFYANILNNSTINANDATVSADTDACFRFEDNNNGMVIQGNSALRSAITKGSGFYFSAGTSAVQFTGNTAERCNKGLVIEGAVYAMGVRDNFFEGNTVDIAIEDGNYKRGLEIDANWFYSATAIQAVAWFSGLLGPNNHFESSGAVTINNSLGTDGALNSLTVWLPRAVQDETAHRTADVIPTNWLLNGSVVVKRQSSIYQSASGPGTARHMLAETVLGNAQIVPRYYVGRPNLRLSYANGGLPYCTLTDTTNPGPGTLVVDTLIQWSTEEMGARFDFYISDSGSTYRICGWVNGTTVFRDDALPQTCVASINGSGNLRLTLGNFTAATIHGGVRII